MKYQLVYFTLSSFNFIPILFNAVYINFFKTLFRKISRCTQKFKLNETLNILIVCSSDLNIITSIYHCNSQHLCIPLSTYCHIFLSQHAQKPNYNCCMFWGLNVLKSLLISFDITLHKLHKM